MAGEGIMAMSKEQREEQGFRMWCYWRRGLLMKLMRNPDLFTKVKEAIEEGKEHEKG